MKTLIESLKNSGKIHHAYLVVGNQESSLVELNNFLNKYFEFETRGNPDYLHKIVDSFGVDEGRELKRMAELKSFGDKKVFVISLNSMTHEAQNSLLKLFEEPTPNTHFFVLAEASHIFIPTLLSRFMIISSSSKNQFDSKDFLGMSPGRRIEFLEGIIKDKDKAGLITIVNSLTAELSKKDFSNINNRVFVLEQLMKMRDYLGDRSASVKMIAEHVSLIVPVLN